MSIVALTALIDEVPKSVDIYLHQKTLKMMMSMMIID